LRGLRVLPRPVALGLSVLGLPSRTRLVPVCERILLRLQRILPIWLGRLPFGALQVLAWRKGAVGIFTNSLRLALCVRTVLGLLAW